MIRNHAFARPFSRKAACMALLAVGASAAATDASAGGPVTSCKSYYACIAQEQKVALQQNETCSEIKRENPRAPCTQTMNPQAFCSQQFTCPAGQEPIQQTFNVIALYYTPPGNGSTVQYESGSISGTTQSIASNLSSSAALQVDVKTQGVEVGGSIGGGTSTGTSNAFQLKSTIGDTELIQSTSDAIDHGHDVIYVWFDPTMVFTWPSANGPQMAFVPPSSGDVQDYLVDELLGREPLPDCNRAPDRAACQKREADFALLRPQDKQQILAVDPYVYMPYTPAERPHVAPDPTRFVPIRTQQTPDGPLPLQGPDNPGDPGISQGIDVSDEGVSSQTVSASNTVTTGFKFGSGADFLGICSVSATVNLNWSWTNTASFGSQSGFKDKAVVTPKTSTVGYYDLIDVYEDALMHSFLFVSESNGNGFPPSEIALSGTVTKAGHPLANGNIVVVLPGGQRRMVHTNARGAYRIYRAPAGRVQLVVAGRTEYETIVPGREAVHDVRM